VGQPSQPFPQQGVDLGGREAVADPLQPARVGAAEDAIVEGLEGDPLLGQLPLGILVAVDAELGVVGEIGAELEEERPEVLVDAWRFTVNLMV